MCLSVWALVVYGWEMEGNSVKRTEVKKAVMKASKALMGWRIKKIERRREWEHGGNAVQSTNRWGDTVKQ